MSERPVPEVIVVDDHDDAFAYVTAGAGHYRASAWWDDGKLVVQLDFHEMIARVAATYGNGHQSP